MRIRPWVIVNKIITSTDNRTHETPRSLVGQLIRQVSWLMGYHFKSSLPSFPVAKYEIKLTKYSCGGSHGILFTVFPFNFSKKPLFLTLIKTHFKSSIINSNILFVRLFVKKSSFYINNFN
tara:strand:- start:499 stop:861 length:363 start_codon:yes stop_codon:yes gene_type:complete